MLAVQYKSIYLRYEVYLKLLGLNMKAKQERHLCVSIAGFVLDQKLNKERVIQACCRVYLFIHSFIHSFFYKIAHKQKIGWVYNGDWQTFELGYNALQNLAEGLEQERMDGVFY